MVILGVIREMGLINSFVIFEDVLQSILEIFQFFIVNSFAELLDNLLEEMLEQFLKTVADLQCIRYFSEKFIIKTQYNKK